MIIYKVTNLVNGNIYIGKTVDTFSNRKSKHLYSARLGSPLYFHASIRKHGVENFKWEIIDYCFNTDFLIALEKYYIEKYDCKAPNGYNLTNGGDGQCGFHHSDQSKILIGLKSKGRKHSDIAKIKIGLGSRAWKRSDETKRKMAVAAMGNCRCLGYKHSPETKTKLSIIKKNCSLETRAKLSAAMIGRRASSETRAKLSATHMGHMMSAETRAKISAYRKGRKWSAESIAKRVATRKARRGDQHGVLTPEI